MDTEHRYTRMSYYFDVLVRAQVAGKKEDTSFECYTAFGML